MGRLTTGKSTRGRPRLRVKLSLVVVCERSGPDGKKLAAAGTDSFPTPSSIARVRSARPSVFVRVFRPIVSSIAPEYSSSVEIRVSTGNRKVFLPSLEIRKKKKKIIRNRSASVVFCVRYFCALENCFRRRSVRSR